MNMAERIKERRKAMGYTQEELANKVGLQKSAIAKYENGRVENIKKSMIAKLSLALECKPSYLMGWDDAPSSAASSAVILSPDESNLLDDYQKLNAEGKAEAQKQVRNLTKIEDYTKDTASLVGKMA